MSNYKGHIFGGVGLFCIARYALKGYNPSILTSIEWLFFTIFGALFPDIDIKSKGQKLFYRLLFLLFCVLFLQQRFAAVALLSLLGVFPLLVKHRGITHSIWFIGTLSITSITYTYLFVPQYASIIFFDTLFFFIGAFSHLWLDLGLRRAVRFR